MKNDKQYQSRISMVIKFLSITCLLILTAFYSTPSIASDAELAESSKCSRYFAMYEDTFHMPSNLIKAVAVTESGKYVKAAGRPVAWPWTVNAQGKGYYFANKREAVRAVADFRSKGVKSIDVGCMQINLLYHPEAFRNLEQAFEPKYNVGYAAKFLRDKYLQARNWQAAVGLYHNGDPLINKNYIKQVYNAWRLEDKSMQVAYLEKPSITVVDAPKTSMDSDVSAITKNVLSTFAR